MTKEELEKIDNKSSSIAGLYAWLAFGVLWYFHNWKYALMIMVGFTVISACIGYVMGSDGKETEAQLNKLKKLRSLSTTTMLSLSFFVVFTTDEELKVMNSTGLLTTLMLSTACIASVYRILAGKKDKDVLLNTFGIVRAGVITAVSLTFAFVWS